jgi:hypothetical protein
VAKSVKLGQISAILNGVPDAKQFEIENESTITYRFIQPNHLDACNDIPKAARIKRSTPIDDNYLLKKYDILFKRLNPDIATLINEDMANTTFSSNLFAIRVSKDYCPAYIACFLETQGIAWLNSNIVGSVAAIRSISAQAIAALDIPVVELDKQNAIGQVWLLSKKRKKLLNELMIEEQRLITALFHKITASAKEEK